MDEIFEGVSFGKDGEVETGEDGGVETGSNILWTASLNVVELEDVSLLEKKIHKINKMIMLPNKIMFHAENPNRFKK